MSKNNKEKLFDLLSEDSDGVVEVPQKFFKAHSLIEWYEEGGGDEYISEVDLEVVIEKILSGYLQLRWKRKEGELAPMISKKGISNEKQNKNSKNSEDTKPV